MQASGRTRTGDSSERECSSTISGRARSWLRDGFTVRTSARTRSRHNLIYRRFIMIKRTRFDRRREEFPGTTLRALQMRPRYDRLDIIGSNSLAQASRTTPGVPVHTASLTRVGLEPSRSPRFETAVSMRLRTKETRADLASGLQLTGSAEELTSDLEQRRDVVHVPVETGHFLVEAAPPTGLLNPLGKRHLREVQCS